MSDPKRYTQWCTASHRHQMLPDRDGMWCMVMDWDATERDRQHAQQVLTQLRVERDDAIRDRDEWQRKFTALKAAHITDAARLLRLEGAIEDYLEGESQGNVLGLRQALEAK